MVNDSEQTPKALLDEYRRQYKLDAASADKSLLVTLRETLENRLQMDPIQSEDIRAAADFSLYFGEDRSRFVTALTDYLSQSLTEEEEAWARWRLVDNLALLEQHVEVVQTQRQFLAWAQKALLSDQLLWVMYDSTQALSWVEIGQGDDWMQIFHSLMVQIPATAENRRNRLIYLESASVVLGKIGQPDEILTLATMIAELSAEDPSWNKALEARLTSLQVAIRAHDLMQDNEAILQDVRTAMALLETEGESSPVVPPSQNRKLMVMYHNMGGTLYLLRQYDLAIPFLRRAVELNSFVEHTYLWLAASLWVTTKNRGEVLQLLREGAHRAIGKAGIASLGYDQWSQLPEFQSVVNDLDFLNATK